MAPTTHALAYATAQAPVDLVQPRRRLRLPDRGSSLVRRGDTLPQRLGHACEDVVPVAGMLLAEEAHGRVPRAIFAVEQPAPVRNEGKGDPDRYAECAG